MRPSYWTTNSSRAAASPRTQAAMRSGARSSAAGGARSVPSGVSHPGSASRRKTRTPVRGSVMPAPAKGQEQGAAGNGRAIAPGERRPPIEAESTTRSPGSYGRAGETPGSEGSRPRLHDDLDGPLPLLRGGAEGSIDVLQGKSVSDET